jgi:hypothetical protein
MLHVTVDPDALQSGDESNVTSGGNVSVIVTPLAFTGPLFVTLSVYVNVSPTVAVPTEAVFVRLRSASVGGTGLIVTVALALLFETLLSVVDVEAVIAMTAVPAVTDWVTMR